jgi:hypothetical protein
MRVRVFLALGFLAVLLAMPASLRADSCTSASNLVANCSFGTGDLTDWTVTTAPSGSDIGVIGNGGYNNDNVAYFGASDYMYDTISQTLTTTASQSYTVSFWLQDSQGDGPDSDTDFQALWNGTSLLDQYTTSSIVEYSFTVTGTGSDTLAFEGYNNSEGLYYLSDISVTAGTATPVPEPSNLWLLGSGLAGLTGMLRRRLV